MSLIQTYQEKAVPKLVEEFELANKMAAPSLKKVVVNMGIGDIRDNKEEQGKIMEELSQIVGQRPNFRQAKQAIAGFGTRRGQIVGVSATLRGKRMYDFLEKLFNVVLPRLRDFRGVSKSAFDQAGNYTLGLTEHTVFPEIDLGKVNKVRGLEITIVMNTRDKQKSLRLLEELGMRFQKEGN